MSEILEATAENGEVKVAAGTVPGCKILSAGKAKSSGIVILVKGQKVYIAIPIDSIGSILDLLSSLADTLSTGINASNTGGPITTPDFATNLSALKQEIADLKGGLQ